MDWGAFLSALGLVFLAELGDKTQLAVLGQTCRYRTPWAVFVGAGLALIAVTALGVIGGQMLIQLLPPSVLRAGAAVAFVVMGGLLALETLRAGREDCAGEGPACTPDPADASTPVWDWRAFGSTFGLLLLAELGDKTQLAVLALVSQSRAPWEVFLGGTLALLGVTGLGVLGGEGLSRFLPQRLLLGGSAGLFVVMGVLMGLGL